jgi:hypothetical protein
MIVRAKLSSLLLAALLPLAACGDDGEDTTAATVTQTAPATETTTGPDETADTTAPEGPDDPAGGCAGSDGNQIEILSGDVDCAAAQQTAAGYDTQGSRVQEIGEWICEGGSAQTRPVIFTCTGPGGEFVVKG